jgi:hypothetical protein
LLAARSSPLSLASLSFTLTEIQDLTATICGKNQKKFQEIHNRKKLIQTNHLTARRRLRLPQEEEEDATLNLLCVQSAVALFFVSFLTRQTRGTRIPRPGSLPVSHQPGLPTAFLRFFITYPGCCRLTGTKPPPSRFK